MDLALLRPPPLHLDARFKEFLPPTIMIRYVTQRRLPPPLPPYQWCPGPLLLLRLGVREAFACGGVNGLDILRL